MKRASRLVDRAVGRVVEEPQVRCQIVRCGGIRGSPSNAQFCKRARRFSHIWEAR